VRALAVLLSLAGALLSPGCINRAAWNYDETERIADAMKKTPLDADEAQGLAMATTVPVAVGPIQTPGYTIDAPAPEQRGRPPQRKPKPGKPSR
jgi:hypothetical protein